MPFGITHLLIIFVIIHHLLLPGGSDGKESVCKAGDMGSISGLGGSSGEENGIPLQYSCLENPVDRRAWQATVHSITVGHDCACMCQLSSHV